MVWVITGDGDALSIGGNHLLHSMRRNVDIKMIMFNNRIYGLTKGQASPTSEFGKRTKSTPAGTIDTPIQPLSVALAAEATFVARSVDTHTEHLQETLKRAGFHKGSAFVEVLQNCNIFNDGAWRDFTEREVRDDRMLVLEHGKPMIFGKDRDKGIRLNGLHPEVVTIGEDGVTEADLLVHDERPRTRTSPRCCRACGGRSSRCRSACCGRPAADARPADRGPDRRTPSRRRRGRPARGRSTAARRGRSSRPAATTASSRPGGGDDGMLCPVCGFDNFDRRGHLRQLRRGHLPVTTRRAAPVVPGPAARRAPRRPRRAAHRSTVGPGHADRRRHRPDARRRDRLRAGASPATDWSASSPTATRS